MGQAKSVTLIRSNAFLGAGFVCPYICVRICVLCVCVCVRAHAGTPRLVASPPLPPLSFPPPRSPPSISLTPAPPPLFASPTLPLLLLPLSLSPSLARSLAPCLPPSHPDFHSPTLCASIPPFFSQTGKKSKARRRVAVERGSRGRMALGPQPEPIL
jgi:hypothetical protein